MIYDLREFACHTTVILAQPRGPRLRADAVYVASPGSTGLRRANSEIHGFQMVFLARRPPRSVLFYWANSAHLSLIQNKDLAAQIGTFLLGKQCAFIPYRKLGPQILLYCWSQQYKRNGCTNSLILLRPTVYLY